MSRILVLIVEDHADTREMLRAVLSARFAVLTASSAPHALRIVGFVKPDVVILDIGMAPVDGIECLRAIRALPEYTSLPAIALTGHAREADLDRFLAAGFDAVIAKPVLDHDAFQATIARVARARGADDRPTLTGRWPFGILSDGEEGGGAAAG